MGTEQHENVSVKLFFLREIPTKTEYKNKVLVYISVEKYLIFFTNQVLRV